MPTRRLPGCMNGQKRASLAIRRAIPEQEGVPVNRGRGDCRMRSEQEMMDTVLEFARSNSHVRVVTLEGSRTNPRIARDDFQDFDITFLVDDLAPFTADDAWLSVFGPVLLMQKPEDMELFPPEQPGYSYLLNFADYRKLDLTLLPLGMLKEYLEGGDGLIRVLLDKDGRIGREIVPTDAAYHLRKPTARMYDDCCNEFWNLTPYVVKGVCRGELLFAVDHLHLLRQELLRMLSWQVGTERGFCFSVGKNYKFLPRFLTEKTAEELMSTYRMDSSSAIWAALLRCHALFRESAGCVANVLGYAYPPYDGRITPYVLEMREKYAKG